MRQCPSSWRVSACSRVWRCAPAQYSSSESATPMKIACCSGSWVVARNVATIASAGSSAVRATKTMSGARPTISSAPMTRIRPPITGIGICSAAPPATITRTASEIPAKTPAHRVRAPALVATPVLESDPPTGSARKNPPARLATPCAMKSPETLVREPSGLGTAAPMPAACASATSATATAPDTRCGTADRSGSTGAGNMLGMLPMSPTFSTSSPSTPTPMLTTSSAIRVAIARSRRTACAAAQTATVASGDQRGQAVPVGHVHQGLTDLQQRVVRVRREPRRVRCHPGDDLQRDARGEPGHHRVGHEAHGRAEPERTEEHHHDADHHGQRRDVVQVGRVQPGVVQDALRGQRDRAGERRGHQHRAREQGTDGRRHHPGVQAQDGVEPADARVGHPLRDAEQADDEPGDGVLPRRPTQLQ